MIFEELYIECFRDSSTVIRTTFTEMFIEFGYQMFGTNLYFTLVEYSLYPDSSMSNTLSSNLVRNTRIPTERNTAIIPKYEGIINGNAIIRIIKLK